MFLIELLSAEMQGYKFNLVRLELDYLETIVHNERQIKHK